MRNAHRLLPWTGALVLSFAGLLPVRAEEPKFEPPKADMSKGPLTFSSGNNSISVGMHIQARATVDDRENFDADPAGTLGAGEEDGPINNFDLPRVRLILKGGFWMPWFKYELQYEFNKTSGDPNSNIKDAVFIFDKSPAATLRVGQYKLPFSMQELTSDVRQQFVERAITNGKFVPGRDLGLSVGGLFLEKRVGYTVGLFNGGGDNRRQDDQKQMWVGRAWWDPLGEYKLAEGAVEMPDAHELHVGLGFHAGEAMKGADQTGSPATDIIEDPDQQTAYNVEVAWKWKRFFATGEYYSMTDEQKNPSPTARNIDSSGFHVQAGIFVIPKKFELGLRYASIDPDDQVQQDAVTELRGVINWYFKGHNLKLQADAGQISWDRAFASLSSLARRGMPSVGTVESGDIKERIGFDPANPTRLEDMQYRLQLNFAF